MRLSLPTGSAAVSRSYKRRGERQCISRKCCREHWEKTMRWKLLGDDNRSRRTFVLVFATGDEILSELLRFAKEQKIASGHFTAIGGCSRVTLGFFDMEKRNYDRTPVDEQVEVMSLIGNIA